MTMIFKVTTQLELLLTGNLNLTLCVIVNQPQNFPLLLMFTIKACEKEMKAMINPFLIRLF